MRFHYVAAQPDGKVTEDDVEASGPAEVLDFMAENGLRPISVKAIAGITEKHGWKSVLAPSINVTDKVFLCKYLALMLRVGTDLFKAIDILIADFDKPAMKALLIEIRESLSKGQPFYSTFLRYPKYFSPVFVNLVRAGEESGNLEGVFEDLSVSLAKEQKLRNQIRSAMVYPALLLCVSVIILTVLLVFALPKLAEIFTSSGIEPPTFSRVVFAVGLFLGKYIWFILPIGIGGVVFIYLFTKKTVVGHTIAMQIFNRLPVVHNVILKTALQRFAAVFSSLTRAGLPILSALEITAQAVGLRELREALLRIAREGLTKGLTIGEAFRRETFFPKTVVNLIAISEKAGHLEEILKSLADFYESEIDSGIKTLVAFLEPAMLLFIGGLIGTIAISI
ncbi:MAG: hypothetical protein A3H06_00100, partial [Candidatus Colwellbacteria bacterium RIFCSPLOWO2_12_FULL_44_13]